MTEEQEQLFESAPEWREHWDDSMPAFTPNVDEVYDSIRVMFRSEADRQAFFDRVGVAPRMEGGNTDDLYFDEGRRKMAESLVEQHPDVVTITEKWGREQHQVELLAVPQERTHPTTGGRVSKHGPPWKPGLAIAYRLTWRWPFIRRTYFYGDREL